MAILTISSGGVCCDKNSNKKIKRDILAREWARHSYRLVYGNFGHLTPKCRLYRVPNLILPTSPPKLYIVLVCVCLGVYGCVCVCLGVWVGGQGYEGLLRIRIFTWKNKNKTIKTGTNRTQKPLVGCGGGCFYGLRDITRVCSEGICRQRPFKRRILIYGFSGLYLYI